MNSPLESLGSHASRVLRKLLLLSALVSTSAYAGQEGWTQETIKVAEVHDASVDFLSYQALVKLPQLDAAGLANASVLCATLLDGTRGYKRSELVALGSVGGRIKCSLMPDHIRIAISVKKGQGEIGADLLKELLDEARFDEKAVGDVLQREPYRQKGYWGAALEPFTGDYSIVSRASVREFYRKIFVPQNIYFAIGGPLDGSEKATLEAKFDRWKPKPEPARYYGAGRTKFIRSHGASISTADFASASFKAAEDLPTRILAAIALGTGKGSSAFRAIRDKNAWSYRQESVLWPTTEGFQVRVIAAFMPTQDDQAIATKMKAAIEEDIETWTEDDRERAVGMVRAILIRGVEFSPFYFEPSGPIGVSLTDRTFLAAYWTLKTGAPFSQEALFNALESVQLDALKSTAKDMMKNAATVVLAGNR